MNNGHKPSMVTRFRAWLLGLPVEKYEGMRELMAGYRGRRSNNSMILGGPTAWTWEATIDDAHHGNRGPGLHADSHARQHALDDAADHTGTITDAQHGSRAAGLHADSHARQHAMDEALDHAGGAEGDVLYGGVAGAWARRARGVDGQLLTLVAGYPDWADAPAVAVHGNAAHDPDFYPLNGTEQLTAALWQHKYLTEAGEPGAVVGNDGRLFYRREPAPGGDDHAYLLAIVQNTAGGYERIQIGIST